VLDQAHNHRPLKRRYLQIEAAELDLVIQVKVQTLLDNALSNIQLKQSFAEYDVKLRAQAKLLA